MSTPAQLIDPNTALDAPPAGFLSPQERAAIENSVDPSRTIQEYQQQKETQQNSVESYELARIQEENRQMRERVEQTNSQIQQITESNANLQGQLTQLTAAQQAALNSVQKEQQFAWSDEEVQNYGEMRPIIEREAARIAAESEQRIQQEVDRRLQEQLAATTAPLTERLAETEQVLQQQARAAENQFNSDLATAVSNLGLPNIHQLVQMPEFNQKFNTFAPGDTVAWGDKLKDNITNRRLHEATAMLKEFRDSSTQYQPRTDVEVPSVSNPRPAQTPQEMQNLNKREQLTQIYEQRQEQFAIGKIPNGWTKAQYREEQSKLRSEINAIPVT